MKQIYDLAIDEFRDVTQADVDRWRVMESKYGDLWRGLVIFLSDHRAEFWDALRNAGLVEGDDQSIWPELVKKYR